MGAIDENAMKKGLLVKQYFEVGEWVAARIVEKPELLKGLPPFLWSFYQMWVKLCKDGVHTSELYNKHFQNKEGTP